MKTNLIKSTVVTILLFVGRPKGYALPTSDAVDQRFQQEV